VLVKDLSARNARVPAAPAGGASPRTLAAWGWQLPGLPLPLHHQRPRTGLRAEHLYSAAREPADAADL
jgi:hypothetical protein